MDREKRDRLLEMTEHEASNLSKDDWYDRVRLLRQRIAQEELKTIKVVSEHTHKEKTTPRSSNVVKAPYKHWQRD